MKFGEILIAKLDIWTNPDIYQIRWSSSLFLF